MPNKLKPKRRARKKAPKLKPQPRALKKAPSPPKAPRTPPAPAEAPSPSPDAEPTGPAKDAPDPETPEADRSELAPAELTSPGGAKMRSYTQQAYSLLSGKYPGLIDDALSRSIVGVFSFASTGSGSHALPAEFDGLEPILVHVSIRRIPGPSFPTDGVVCEAQFDDDSRNIDVNATPGLMYTGFALFQKGDQA